MACVTASGALTPSGHTLLQALTAPATAPELAAATGLPLFRIRAALREFVEAGLAEERDGAFGATATGLARLQAAQPAG
jgi:DNA-binding IclR family transcriptional regulator